MMSLVNVALDCTKVRTKASPKESANASMHKAMRHQRILRSNAMLIDAKEPLAWPALHEPELHDLRRLFSVACHQSRTCTLSTLSSRVWSLSVRVLTFKLV